MFGFNEVEEIAVIEHQGNFLFHMCDQSTHSSIIYAIISYHTWNAVCNGSTELRAINDGLARARYSLTLDKEWRRESSDDFLMHSSHGHFTSCGNEKKNIVTMVWIRWSNGQGLHALIFTILILNNSRIFNFFLNS